DHADGGYGIGIRVQIIECDGRRLWHCGIRHHDDHHDTHPDCRAVRQRKSACTLFLYLAGLSVAGADFLQLEYDESIQWRLDALVGRPLYFYSINHLEKG